MMRLATVLAAAAAVAEVAALSASGLTVQTTGGTVQGYETDLAYAFTSIPYAKPPVGPLRWKNPEPAVPWSGVLQATSDPPGCPQKCDLPPHTCPTVQSEDCLFLSVFRPKNVTSKLPVAVFMPGGDYKVGYSGGVLYDCSVLVSEQNFVCVTINYRLGALGFLYTGTDGDSITGNFGMLDQQLALKWVASNAAAFGGDPANVNIFGQSAGAVSVALHNVAPSSKSLFNRTLMMSMPFSLPLRTPDTWKPLADSYIKHAGCSTGLIKNIAKEIECIRALPADKLVEAQVAAEHDILDEYKRAVELFLPWTPTLGSDLVPVSPIDAFHSGQLPDPSKPVIATTVENEAVLFVWQAFTKPMSSLEYDLLVDVIFAGSGGKVKKQFPLPDNMKADARPWLAHIATFGLLVCPTRYAMAGMTAPAYVGHFDHVMSFGKAIWGPDYTECDDVVCHGSDLVPLFRPDPADIGGQYTPAEVALSQSMQTYAGSFFHDGVPAPPATGVDAGLTWPRFNMTQQMYMQYQTPANVQTSHTYETECGFFDSIGYHFY